jgi:hypothetical protein
MNTLTTNGLIPVGDPGQGMCRISLYHPDTAMME